MSHQVSTAKAGQHSVSDDHVTDPQTEQYSQSMDGFAAGRLNSRQTAVIQMQRRQGNAAVCRMLAPAVQREIPDTAPPAAAPDSPQTATAPNAAGPANAETLAALNGQDLQTRLQGMASKELVSVYNEAAFHQPILTNLLDAIDKGFVEAAKAARSNTYTSAIGVSDGAVEAMILTRCDDADVFAKIKQIPYAKRINLTLAIQVFISDAAQLKRVNEQLTRANKEDSQEADYETRGKTVLEQIGEGVAPPIKPGADSGHADTGPMAGYPDWFNKLQARLNFSTTWTGAEESAQSVLHDYATWRAARDNGGKLPANLEVFFRYIGRSRTSVAANQKVKGEDGTSAPTARDLGATGSNWCAPATSSALIISLRERGLRIKGGGVPDDKWNNASKRTISGSAAQAAPFQAGDQVSYVGASTPLSGHVVTVVSANGDNMTTVSGNTTMVAGGGTAVGQTRRAPKPEGFDYYKGIAIENEKNPTTKAELEKAYPEKIRKPPQGADYVYVVSIVRYSEVDASQIDPNNAEQLNKLGLERIPQQSTK